MFGCGHGLLRRQNGGIVVAGDWRYAGLGGCIPAKIECQVFCDPRLHGMTTLK